MTYLNLLYYAVDYYTQFKTQKRFIQGYLEPMVLRFCNMLDYQLTAHEKQKMFRYYPLLSVCALAETYIFLKERPLTDIERQRITLMSAMATLCDDLIDEDNWDEEQLLNLLENKTPYSSLPKKAKLIVAMNEEFKKLNINPIYWKQLKKAFHGQADSIRQHQPDLTLAETITIEREKNGSYCLCVSALIDENWTALEEDFVYQHGIIGQIGNDVYDTYKDVHQNIYTIVRKVNSIAELKELYLKECKVFREMILEMKGTLQRKKKLIRKLTCVDAFTLYGIHQLQDVENKYGQDIPWKDVTRKELIVDMEINANRWKYIKTAIALSKEVEK